MSTISIFRRVYYDDTDSGGVVYHTNYLRYMEHARTDLLRLRGFGPEVLVNEYGVLFAVTDISLKYIAAARLGDEIEITATIREMGGTKIEFEQEVWRVDENRIRTKKLTLGSITVVCLTAADFRPAKIPADLKERFARER